jgi:hypothetical protein
MEKTFVSVREPDQDSNPWRIPAEAGLLSEQVPVSSRTGSIVINISSPPRTKALDRPQDCSNGRVITVP